MPTPQRVFITRRLPDIAPELLRDAGVSVSVGQTDEEKGIAKPDIARAAAHADAIISLLTDTIDRDVLTANPRLLGVSNYAVGFNNIDVAAATELGIPVTNTPGVLTETSADLTWALMLAVARRIVEAHEYMVAGRYMLWGPNLMLGADIGTGASGVRKVLGVIGYGRIGSAVARRAIGFDMDVVAYNGDNTAPIDADARDPSRHLRSVSLDELLRTSDFICLHTSLTPRTRHMIGERELAMMKPTAFLINVARGPVVDEAALVAALQNGTIAGAGLDVYEHEPAMTPGLAELRNVVLLPHIASASRDTRDVMAAMVVADTLANLRGERAANIVNPEVYGSPAHAARLRASRE